MRPAYISPAALLYRLSGDLNPLHASPQVAGDAGYSQPILHGLCTMGVATHALMKVCCHYEPERFKRIRLRFSAPVYPGETIRTEIWREGQTIAFRCWSLEQEKWSLITVIWKFPEAEGQRAKHSQWVAHR